jgi:acetate kinase
MKILVINCGSSSIKYRVFQTVESAGLHSLALAERDSGRRGTNK